MPRPGRPFTIRQALLQTDVPGGRVSGIPAAVAEPPRWVPATAASPVAPGASVGAEVWSMARPGPELEELR